MNGTERYYNDRIQPSPGLFLAKYDPSTFEVTSSPPQIVVSSTVGMQTITDNTIANTTGSVTIDLGNFAGLNGQWTCVVPGTYWFAFGSTIAGSNILGTITMSIRKNGQNIAEYTSQSIPIIMGHTNRPLSTCILAEAEADDVFDIFFSLVTTTTANLNPFSAWIITAA